MRPDVAREAQENAARFLAALFTVAALIAAVFYSAAAALALMAAIWLFLQARPAAPP